MNPKLTALLSVVVTGFGATVIAPFTTTPELVTQVAVGVLAFLAAGVVLLALWWTPWLRALPPQRQRRTIWIAACGTGLVVCVLPLLLAVFRS